MDELPSELLMQILTHFLWNCIYHRDSAQTVIKFAHITRRTRQIAELWAQESSTKIKNNAPVWAWNKIPTDISDTIESTGTTDYWSFGDLIRGLTTYIHVLPFVKYGPIRNASALINIMRRKNMTTLMCAECVPQLLHALNFPWLKKICRFIDDPTFDDCPPINSMLAYLPSQKYDYYDLALTVTPYDREILVQFAKRMYPINSQLISDIMEYCEEHNLNDAPMYCSIESLPFMTHFNLTRWELDLVLIQLNDRWIQSPCRVELKSYLLVEFESYMLDGKFEVDSHYLEVYY